ncbi:MAG: hypothetical protein GC134_01030 [Proteobacteria bacterium]|nr:hypothetical protein [Pseudomonadota bacterium]
MQVIRTLALADGVALTPELKAVLEDLHRDADIAVTGIAAPYALEVGYVEGEVLLSLAGSESHETFAVPLRALRGVLRDYLRISESFHAAISSGDLQRFEAIDLGKKALHDEAAEMLVDMLAPQLRLGHGTARKLFTLICALQPSGKTLLE